MRLFIVVASAAVLSACATAQSNPSASLQNTVFVVGDQAVPMQATAMPASNDVKPEPADDSTLRQLFWPLSGR